MGAVTVGALFHDIRMFEEKGAAFLSMALDTGFFYGVLDKILCGKTVVGVVAVNTEDSALLEGMMTRQGKLGLGRRVATEAEFTRSEWCDL